MNNPSGACNLAKEVLTPADREGQLRSDRIKINFKGVSVYIWTIAGKYLENILLDTSC